MTADVNKFPRLIGSSFPNITPQRALRMRSVKVAAEDAGVTVHDVVIVGDDDAPVLSLKGLRLKAMGKVPEDQRFTLER